MNLDQTRPKNEAGCFGMVHCAALGKGARCFALMLEKNVGKENEIIY
jgi:hypothetical protein